MKKRLLMAASLVLMLASIGLLVYLAAHEPGRVPPPDATPAGAPAAEVRITAPIYTTGPLSTLSPDEQQLAKALKERYGQRLDHPFWRISAIESLIRFLQKKYPNDWKMRLRDLLGKIFPDQAAALLATLEAYDRYNEWLRDSQWRWTSRRSPCPPRSTVMPAP